MSERYDGVVEALAQFGWKGDLNAYVIRGPQGTITVPRGNPSFQLIQERIARGDCAMRMPDFQFAAKVVGRKGRLTGHQTAAGFVPLDAQNALRVELDRAISAGSVVDAGVAPKATLPPCSHIKFCVFFPRPWPHLKGPFSGAWRYRSTVEAKWINLAVRLSNHPTTPQSSIAAAMVWLGVQPLDQTYSLGPVLQHSMLEIEIGIGNLWDLYRGERKAGFGVLHEFIEDQLDRSLVEDDRVGDAPDTRALVFLAPQFLHRAITDISNRVAAEFNLEYGGHSVGFLTERDTHEQHVCLLRDGEGAHHLFRMGWQPQHSFNLEGDWRFTDRDPADVDRLSLSRLSNRLRALIDAGFALEAISLANGFFELACRQVLAALLPANSEEQSWVLEDRRLGYDRCRALMKMAVKLAPSSSECDNLLLLLGQLQTIYDKRNAYMHGLQVLTHDLTRSVDLTREAMLLLAPLIDAWETRQKIGLLHTFTTNGVSLVGDEAVAAVSGEVCKLMTST